MLKILDLCFSSQGWLNHLTLKGHGGERDLAVGPLLMITETHKVSPPSPAPNQGSSEVSPSICASSLRIWQFYDVGGKREEGTDGPQNGMFARFPWTGLRDCQGLWWRNIWASGRRRGVIRKCTDHQASLLFPSYCGFWNTTHCLSLQIWPARQRPTPPGLFSKFAKGKWKQWEEH